MSNLYERIEDLCKVEGINITEMCRRAEVPRGNLTDLLKGRQQSLSTKNMVKIANYFNVSVEYLATGKKEKPATENDELEKYIDMLRNRPEMRLLLDTQDGAIPNVFIGNAPGHIPCFKSLDAFRDYVIPFYIQENPALGKVLNK